MMMSAPAASWRVAEVAAPWRQASGDLPDVNVWLALSLTQHPFHALASAYWRSVCESGTPLWFCRSTMLSLVRLLSQPRVMGAAALSLPAAMAVFQQWVDTPDVALLPEPVGLDEQLQALLGSPAQPLPSRLWTDAFLAATAESAGLRMVTFDADFKRFKLTRLHLLESIL
jgi:uncharacterized protein